MSLFEYLKNPDNRKDLAQFIEKRMPELLDCKSNTINTLSIIQREDYYILVCCSEEKFSKIGLSSRYNIKFFNNDSDFNKFSDYDGFFTPKLTKKFIDTINQYKRKIKLREINGKGI